MTDINLGTTGEEESYTPKLRRRPRRQIKFVRIGLFALLLVAAAFLGRLSNAPEPATNTQVMMALQGLNQNIEHLRWVAAQYEDEAVMPSPQTIAAAYSGNREAIQALEDNASAGSLLNMYHFNCADLTELYNQLSSSLDSDVRRAQAAAGLPPQIPAEHCWNGSKDDPFVPAFGRS